MSVPSVSVVMPVRNALPFIDAAIASVLGQTLTDFEFIIGDDGSNDGSTDRLDEWAARDTRIRLFKRDGPPLGPALSSAWVAGHASALIVARMDADDVSRSDCLARQYAALTADGEAVAVGTLWDGIDHRGRPVHGPDFSTLFDPSARPFLHNIMYRRMAYEAAGGYRQGTDYWEDDDLFWRLSEVGKVLVLPLNLYSYRYSGMSSRFSADWQRVENAYHLGYLWGLHRKRGVRDADLDEWRSRPPARVAPEIFVGIGYANVWCGRSSGVLGRMLRRADLRLDRRSMRVLIWAVVSSLFPRLLRSFLRLRRQRRDRAAQARVCETQVYEWSGSPFKRYERTTRQQVLQ